MPETLIFETEAFGDTVLIERVLPGLSPETKGSAAFLIITGGSAFLSADEALALASQLIGIVFDAQQNELAQ